MEEKMEIINLLQSKQILEQELSCISIWDSRNKRK